MPERHVMIVAGEPSGDALGGALLDDLIKKYPGKMRFSGLGGHYMERAKFRSLFPLRTVTVMGFFEVIRYLPKILRGTTKLVDHACQDPPHVLVIIDSPDFTHLVARRIKKRLQNTVVVNYVPPSLWAWRKGRARKIRKIIDHLMVLYPFEKKFFQKEVGRPCVYVGHPALRYLSNDDASEKAASAAFQRLHGLSPKDPVLLLCPGSRVHEHSRLLPIFHDTIVRLKQNNPRLQLVLLTLKDMKDAVRHQVDSWPWPVALSYNSKEKRGAFACATAALAASGTVSVELGLCGVPMVVAYKTSFLSGFIGQRLVKVASVVLVNLVLKKNVIPEFLQGDCKAAKLALALSPLLKNTPSRQTMVQHLRDFKGIMTQGIDKPNDKAATLVARLAGVKKA